MLTLTQFKDWIDTVFPDNRARAIQENNFRDGLKETVEWVDQRAKAAEDHVDQTNSDTYIQQSISLAQAAANLAHLNKEVTQALLTQAQAAATQARLFQDGWDMVANLPDLTAMTLGPDDAGLFWKVKKVAPGGSVNPLTDDEDLVQVGDELTWNGSTWVWVPASDLALQKAQALESIVQQLEGHSGFSDPDGYLALRVLDDGTIEMFRQKTQQIELPANTLLTATAEKATLTRGEETLLEIGPRSVNQVPISRDDDGTTNVGTFSFQENPDVAQAWGDDDGYLLNGFDEQGNLLKASIAEKLIEGGADLMHIPVYGQSLSIGGGSGPALSTAELEGVYTFSGGHLTGLMADPANGYSSLVPFREGIGVDTESPSYGIASSLLQAMQLNRVRRGNMAFLMSNPGQGGQSLAQLAKGSAYYTRLLTAVQKGLELAAAQGKTYQVPALVWIQGEADKNTPVADYVAGMLQLKSDLNADIKAITGQAEDIPIVLYQTALSETSNPGSTLAHYQLGMEHEGFHLALPMHMFSYQEDQTHLSNLSSLHMGAIIGAVLEKVIFEQVDWKPLSVQKIFRQGRILQLTFHLPVGGELQVDPTISNPGNYGFQLLAGTTNKAISSVEIVRSNTIRLVAAEPIQPGWELRYAIKNGMAGESGPMTGSRGCIRDNQPYIFQHPTGPYRVYNWLPAFRTIIQ